MVYLDYNATTSLDYRVKEKMLPYLEKIYSSPSSVYKFVKSSHRAIEEARQKVDFLLGAKSSEIIFTSSGTEYNNTTIKGLAFTPDNKRKHITTSRIEHRLVLNPCKFSERIGFEVTYINVDSCGVIDIDGLKGSLKKN